MSDSPIQQDTLDKAQAFMRQYAISAINLQADTGIDQDTPVCNVSLYLQQNKKAAPVMFKLQNEAANYHQFITSIAHNQQIEIELGKVAERLTEAALNEKLLAFFDVIDKRAALIDKEEKIQGITFQGNSFIINQTIEINVLDDDGAGNLDIEIIKGNDKNAAKMRANDLMDGLYLGSIKEKH